MNLTTYGATAQEQKAILQAAKRLKIDVLHIINIFQKTDAWQAVRGILNKKPTGLQYQRSIRKEWV